MLTHRPRCRILKEERNYILQMIKKIRASGCNVLLIQKSILRDAVTDLSLHYLVCTCPPCTQHGLVQVYHHLGGGQCRAPSWGSRGSNLQRRCIC